MKDAILTALYETETALYKEIQQSPAFEQLVALQKLIKQRGGTPKFIIARTLSPFQKTEEGSTVSETSYTNNALTNGYDKTWVWDQKTRFALKRLKGKGSPKDIIDLITRIEGVPVEDNVEKTRIANNVYNALTKLKRNQEIVRDESIKDYPLYVLTNEETFL